MANVVDKTKARTLEILKVSKDEVERGLELHRSSIVMDSLAQDPWPASEKMMRKKEEMLDAGKSVEEINPEDRFEHACALVKDPKAREEYKWAWDTSGVTCVSQGVHYFARAYGCFEGTVRRITASMVKLDALKDVATKAICAGDIRRAKNEGKHAVMWNFQNTLVLGGGFDVDRELDRLNLFYGMGVRIIQLTYNLRNFVGDGCTERYGSGLTYFGTKVVERMNELGMLVDTSHSGYQTTLDAVRVSEMPIAATHTTCKAVHMHDRGKTDEELKAIAEKGGYVGICVVPAFLGGNGTIKEFLDHIDHAVNLIGADHVGIGTDTGYSAQEPPRLAAKMIEETKSPISGNRWWLGFRPEHQIVPDQLTQVTRIQERRTGSLAWINWPYFTVGLVSRGYSDREIQGIIGGNFLNLLEKVIG